jgi:transposase
MGRPVLRVKGYSPDDIKALIRKDDQFQIGIRLYAVLLVAQGKPSRQVEELFGVSFKQVTNWVHRFEKDGVEGLRDREGRGRKPKLGSEALLEVESALTQSPEAFGYNSATWTGPMLGDWIKKRFNVEYKRAQVYNLIHVIGFSHQKSRPSYPEADKVEQEEFKERLKKTPGGKP